MLAGNNSRRVGQVVAVERSVDAMAYPEHDTGVWCFTCDGSARLRRADLLP